MRIIRRLHEGRGQNNSKVVHEISIKKVQLLHEVADYGYLEGEMISDELAAAKRETQDVVQEGNAQRIVRIMDLAYTKVLSLLSPLTDDMESGGAPEDDVPDRREDYDVAISVDTAWPEVRLEHLRNLVHNFILYHALYQWLSITSPNAADKWKVQSDEIADEIKDIRFMGGMYKRPYRPF